MTRHISYTVPEKICMSALLLAMGVLLPDVFHLMWGAAAGQALLPMYIPVLVAGLVMGPSVGAAVGMFMPVFSFMTTGMPPLVRLPFMVGELVCMGMVAGIGSRRGLNGYISLAAAQISGRLVYSFSVLTAVYIFGIVLPPSMAAGAVIMTGIPGLILQHILIPPLLLRVNRLSGKEQ